LARWQAEHVAERLHALGAAVDIIAVSTLGDRILDRAISELPGSAPFTDDIEQALRAGEIDLAVHSLKDLPLAPREDLRVAAILPRGDPGEHGGSSMSPSPQLLVRESLLAPPSASMEDRP
jgi:hydroxymethylbilane synthase